MSEQLPQPDTTSNVADAQLAQEVTQSAQRYLQAQGVLQPDELTEQSTVPAFAVSAPSPTTRPSAQEIRGSYDQSKTVIGRGIINDPHFEMFCLDRGVDIVNTVKAGAPEYCSALSDYVQGRVAMSREKDGDSLTMTTLGLLAATPNYLYHQKALNLAREANQRPPYNSLVAVSSFNGLVRNLATNYPEAKVSDMSAALKQMALFFKLPEDVSTPGLQSINKLLVGAQHETGYGQILAASDHQYRSATTAEDLNGIDYVIDEDTDLLTIDVKASLAKIKREGVTNTSFVCHQSGKVTMWSGLQTEQFGDKFYIHPSRAAAQVAIVDSQIERSREANHARMA